MRKKFDQHFKVQVALAISSFDGKDHRPKDYCDNNVSQKVVKIIQSYTYIVDDIIWNKNGFR